MNTSLDSDFYKKFTKFYLLNGFTSVRWKPCVHGNFQNILTFKTQMSSHAKRSKDKQKLKVTRNPNPRHAIQTTTQTQPNTS